MTGLFHARLLFLAALGAAVAVLIWAAARLARLERLAQSARRERRDR